jgi:HrpA-like RNA helicase
MHGTDSANEVQNVQYKTVEDRDREVRRLHDSMAQMSHLDPSLPHDQDHGIPTDNQRVRKVAQGGAGGGLREVLPIDEYKAVILGCIQSSSVTCVHGETGCGKSSMVGACLACWCCLFSLL